MRLKTYALSLVLLALSAFAQAPVDSGQLDKVSYDISAIQTFPTFSRDSYRAKFGMAAAECNPAKPLKSWFDRTTVGESDDITVYRVVGRDAKGLPAIKQLVLQNSEAEAVNLPGREKYPSYKPEPTLAGHGNQIGTVEAVLLSTMPQASQFAALFGGTIEEDPGTSIAPYHYPPDEPRRVWNVVVGNVRYNVGWAISQQNRDGIGAPGRWTVDALGWGWVPRAVPDCAGKDDWRPVPVRALMANEQLSSGLMGAMVVRTDKQQAQAEVSGSFTAEDREMLRAIYKSLIVTFTNNAGTTSIGFPAVVH